jgi:hypothetical protein
MNMAESRIPSIPSESPPKSPPEPPSEPPSEPPFDPPPRPEPLRRQIAMQFLHRNGTMTSDYEEFSQQRDSGLHGETLMQGFYACACDEDVDSDYEYMSW